MGVQAISSEMYGEDATSCDGCRPDPAGLRRIPVEPIAGRPSKTRLNERLISFDAAQFPDDSRVCLVKEQADGSFETVMCQPVGDKNVQFYVPYPGDRYFLAGDGWVSQNDLSEACTLKNGVSKDRHVMSLTERDMMALAEEQPLAHFQVVTLIQKGARNTSPMMGFLVALVNFFFWFMMIYCCFQCCCGRPLEAQEVFVIRQGDFASPPLDPDTPRFQRPSHGGYPDAAIHIVEQPAHVPVEQAFYEQPSDLPQRRSNSPTVRISEELETVFNENADALTSAAVSP